MAQEDNPFWRWSLDHYALPGVETVLLRLQDEFGIDVNIALYCCWRGDAGSHLDDATLHAAIEACGAWTASVIAPLRAARVYLKTAGAAHRDLRNQVKQAELDAEYQAQNLLFALASNDTGTTHSGQFAAARDNLDLYAHIIDAPKAADALLRELIDHIFARRAGGDESRAETIPDKIRIRP